MPNNSNKTRIQALIDSMPVGTTFTARELSNMFGKNSPPIQAYGWILNGMQRIDRLPSRRGETTTYVKVE